MNTSIWIDSFSVGDEILDKHHQIILESIYELNEHKDISINSELVTNILNDVYKYVQVHLECEERLLEKLDYPDLEEHNKYHLEYHESIMEILIKATEHKEKTVFELLNFLMHWWKDHILVEDMKYKAFIESHKNKIAEIRKSSIPSYGSPHYKTPNILTKFLCSSRFF